MQRRQRLGQLRQQPLVGDDRRRLVAGGHGLDLAVELLDRAIAVERTLAVGPAPDLVDPALQLRGGVDHLHRPAKRGRVDMLVGGGVQPDDVRRQLVGHRAAAQDEQALVRQDDAGRVVQPGGGGLGLAAQQRDQLRQVKIVGAIGVPHRMHVRRQRHGVWYGDKLFAGIQHPLRTAQLLEQLRPGQRPGLQGERCQFVQQVGQFGLGVQSLRHDPLGPDTPLL